jgi:hypothetical protein
MKRPALKDIGAVALLAFAALSVATLLWAGYVVWEKVNKEIVRGDQLTQSLAASEAGVLRLQRQVEMMGGVPAPAPAPITVPGRDGLSIIGPAGLQGDKGLPGLNGATGLTGKTGATGVAGSVGSSGTNGAVGANGTPGAAGVAGADGAAGKNGQDGKDGKDGVSPAVVYCKPPDSSGTQTCTTSSPTPSPTP